MNFRKGLTRFAFVWIVLWGLWFWSGYQMQKDGERGFMEASARHYEFGMEYNGNIMTRGAEQISQAVHYGLLMPIALAIVAGVAFWIWRGFRPKQIGEPK